MKVLFIIESLATGGKERRLLELLKGLKNYKDVQYELIILSDRIDYDIVALGDINIHILKRNIVKDPLILNKFLKIYHIFEPDIVHCWDNIAAIHFAPIVKLFGKPFLNSSISAAPPNLQIYKKRFWVTALSYPFSDIILSNSEAGLISYRVPVKKGKVIYNGFDLKRLEHLNGINKIRKNYNIRTKYVVGMVASFSDFKDYHTFDIVAKKILNIRNDITFIGVGDGQNRNKILDSKSSELQNYLIYPGKINDIESLVNLFDIGILLTNKKNHGEGIPNSVMEYMALGKPVIATDVGGTKELVIDGGTGFLLKENNPNKIIEKIFYFIDNPNIAIKMGEEGKRRIINRFNLEIMTRKYVELYKQFQGR